jgi:hypothetical protein
MKSPDGVSSCLLALLMLILIDTTLLYSENLDFNSIILALRGDTDALKSLSRVYSVSAVSALSSWGNGMAPNRWKIVSSRTNVT